MLTDMSGVTIKETRHLVLPLQTVLDAVVHYDRRNHGALLNGEALQAEFVFGNIALEPGDLPPETLFR